MVLARGQLSLVAAIGVALLAACTTQSNPTPSVTLTSSTVDGTEPGDLDADLPCDVASVLGSACTKCHGATPEMGALNRLMTYADLAGPSRFDPSMTEAQRCLARMANGDRPMPPNPDTLATETQVAVLRKWIDAGYPKSTSKLGGCLPVHAPIDFSAGASCSTQKRWTGGDRHSPEMYPGIGCNECHRREREGPIYPAAGTVYRSAHEPDNCYGAVGIKVVLTDATGAKFTATANEAGNFMFTKAFKAPYRAKLVLKDGSEIAMISEQTEGDCNTCHTPKGEKDARGRIAVE